MYTRRTLTRRVEENNVHEEIPPQVEEVEEVPEGAQGNQVPDVSVVPPELNNSAIR